MSTQSLPLNVGVGNTKRPPCSKIWCFTYNNYKTDLINYNLCLQSLCELFNKHGEYTFQEETGANGTEHLQGVIKFSKKVRPMETIAIKTIHWEKCRSYEHSVNYCGKVETRTGSKFSNIVDTSIHVCEPYGWQLEVMNIINAGPDKRKIHWFYSKHGNIGKTELAKFLCVKHKALYVNGKAADMKSAIAEMKVKPKLVVLGFPRTIDTDYISYSGIEEIKDGIFFSGKYESGMCLFESPLVIVLCNHPPCTEKLSKDRWNIQQIIKIKDENGEEALKCKAARVM